VNPLPAHEQRNRHFDALAGDPRLLWLGQNTNHLPPHPAVLEAMRSAIDRAAFNAYAPPLGMERLRALILEDLGLPAAQFGVIVTDGAVAGLSHVVRSLLGAGDRMIAADPGWKWPLIYARAVGAEPIELPIYDPTQRFRLAPAQLRAAAGERTRLIYLVDPNNPLGSRIPAEDIAAIAAVAREADATVIHDCTYRHFAEGHTLLAHAAPDRTVTTYSFSKWLGLAGMRVGAIVAAHDMIGRLAAAAPNALGSSVLAQHAAIAGLTVKQQWLPAVIDADRAAKQAIAEAVARVPGLALPITPSHGNFVAIDVSGASIRPEALCFAYRRADILIRQGAYHSARFADRFVKVSTTVPADWMARFCELLPAMVEEARRMNEVPDLF
jgi:aspartate/methionine/tyrosine aminotransferase